MALLLVGCAVRRAPPSVVDPLDLLLAQHDATWAARQKDGATLAHWNALLELRARAPADPRIAWRVARAAWTLGYLESTPAAARERFETAWEAATACVVVANDAPAALRRTRWRLDGPVVAGAGAEVGACLAWAAAAGTSLAEIRGQGAAVVAERACGVAKELLLVDATAGAGIGAWAAGRCLVAARDPAQQEEGRALLRDAVSLAPADAFFRAELARFDPESPRSGPSPGHLAVGSEWDRRWAGPR